MLEYFHAVVVVILGFTFISSFRAHHLLLVDGVALNSGNVEWIDSQNISNWYTPMDLCILSNTSTASVESIIKHCEDRHPTLTSIPVRCRAGNSWPSRSEYCSAEDLPFKERDAFRKTTRGMDDPSVRPLESFFSKLSKKNGAMLVIGDSVMQQFFSAIACELEREGVWNDPSKFTNTDEVQYVKPKGASKPVTMKFLPIYHFVNGRWDRIANASMHHLTTAVETMSAKHDSLVIILNMGLHYVDNPVAGFSRADYVSQMTDALGYLHRTVIKHPSRNIKVFWRETSAQHFPTPNGYWPGQRYSNTLKLACEPIADPSPQADWRNRDVENIILHNNFFNVNIIRFYNQTLPLWSQHPNGKLKDCTHFCFSPMLYQSTFQTLDKFFK